MTERFPYMRVKAPTLSPEAVAEIERLMKWEDDSWRRVMGTEPPWLASDQLGSGT